jgi:hypothetical protein
LGHGNVIVPYMLMGSGVLYRSLTAENLQSLSCGTSSGFRRGAILPSESRQFILQQINGQLKCAFLFTMPLI